MKKLVFLLGFIFVLVLGANAQKNRVWSLRSEYNSVSDTVTNTGTVYMNVKAALTDSYNLTISGKATQLTGTTAGTAILEWSLNGTDFATHPTADTMTVTDGAVFLWELTTTGAVKYRINFTGSGTSTTEIEGQYIYKE